MKLRERNVSILAVLGMLWTSGLAHGQVLTVLHAFGAVEAVSHTNVDGANPLGALTLNRDGSFYGTAENGGTNGTGTIFKISAAGAYSLVHTFGAFIGYTNADGAYPVSALTAGPDGSFYGMAAGGGAFGNYGTVFKVATNDALTVLHSFDYSDGENPAAPLAFGRDGWLYGETELGGDTGNGTIFRISTNGDFQTLYSFSMASNSVEFGYTNSDGSRPYGLTLGRDGNFYGVAQFGGTNGNGTVFEFTTNGTFKLLHTFSVQTNGGANLDGAAPQAALTQGPDGGFYGTTPNGGSNGVGVIYRVAADGTFSTVLNLDYFENGAYGDAPVTWLGGRFITATAGGFSGGGTILLVTTNGGERVLYDFSAPNGNSENSDGASPEAGLTVGADGNFYGVTTAGGANGSGTIFRLSFPALAIAHSGNTSVLSWPTNQVGFTLEWTTNLAQPIWTALTNVVVVGDQFVVTNAGGGTHGFYNLVK